VSEATQIILLGSLGITAVVAGMAASFKRWDVIAWCGAFLLVLIAASK
jgi:hypothetical protein